MCYETESQTYILVLQAQVAFLTKLSKYVCLVFRQEQSNTYLLHPWVWVAFIVMNHVLQQGEVNGSPPKRQMKVAQGLC